MGASYSDFVPLEPVTLTPFVEGNSGAGVAIVNGQSFPFISARVELNAHGFTNSAEVVLNISMCPDFSVTLTDAATPTSSDSSSSVYIELWAGLQPTPQYENLSLEGMIRVFLGVIEDTVPNFNQDTIKISCRSAAADLADTKITKTTLGEVVSTAFLQEQTSLVGLNYSSPNPGISNPVTIQQVLGKEFVGGSSFSTAIYRKSAAELLVQAATFDDCDTWLEDDTIYYQTAASVNRGAPINLMHGRDFTLEGGPEGTHALRQSKNIQVDVHSFTARTRTSTRSRIAIDPATGAITKTSGSVSVTRSIPLYGSSATVTTTTSLKGSSTSTSTSSGGNVTAKTSLASAPSNVEKYDYYVQNQNQQTCDKLALAIARQIALLEYRLTFTIPMTRALFGKLRIISAFNVSGLPYQNFNDTYFARRITHDISNEAGWKITVDAVNHTMLQGEQD